MLEQTHNAQAGSWDATTVRAAIDGCPDAWAIVIRETRLYVTRLLIAKGAGRDDAEDIVQLAYCRAWERRAQFRHGDYEPAAWRNWLVQIALNAWRDLLRHRSHLSHRGQPRIFEQNHCELTANQAYDYRNVTDDAAPESAIIRDEDRAEATAMIAQLTAALPWKQQQYASLLVTCQRDDYYGGMTTVHIPSVMAAIGMQRSAAKSAMHRTREAMRDAARLLNVVSA